MALDSKPADPAPVSIPKYFPALDGIRFTCAAAVIVAHAYGEDQITRDFAHPFRWLVANLGSASVDVFFSLSGFLITGLLIAEGKATGSVDLKAFYIRRTLRIWPVYYLSLAIGFLGATLLGTRFTSVFGYSVTPDFFRVSLPSHLAFMGNWSDRDILQPIAILWSVCIEEQFYILFPLTFVFSRRPSPVFLAAGLGWLLAMARRYYLARHGQDFHYDTFAHADNLLAGGLLAQMLHSSPKKVLALCRRLGGFGESASLALLVIVLRWGYGGEKTPNEAVAFGVLSALATSLLIASFGLGEGPGARLLARKPLRQLGQLTYATYCLHLYPLAIAWAAVNRLLPNSDAWSRAGLRAVLAIFLSLGLAWICRVTFELRFLKLKERFEPVRALT